MRIAKAIWSIPILFVVCVFADEADDRAAIRLMIAKLNDAASYEGVFAAAGEGAEEFQQFRKARPASVRIVGPESDGRAAVTISHEPWGEASISFPGRRITFITPDVALAEATYVMSGGALPDLGETRLLIVLKKEGREWKIASFRMVASK